jgi:hypothetical protein
LARIGDAVLTACAWLVAAPGVALAWADGLLPQLTVAVLACALVAPAVHRPKEPRR